jgi:quercetin dioxygenase-like cupin family protein
MLDFKIKRLDNIKFEHHELLMYYENVKKKYQHLKWTVDSSVDTKTHQVENMYSWAIQSNLKDPTKPCPPYHIKNDDDTIESNTFDVETELNFGFAKKILDSFNNIRQTVIAAHPPNTVIDLHTDTDNFVKVHIPIITNDKSYFFFEDEEYNLKAGHAYLVNTSLPHGTKNLGNDDRVHFIFKIPVSEVDNILNNEYLLDVSLFDFDIIELPNIKFDFQELLDYYNKVDTDYNHLKWIMPPKDPSHDPNSYPNGYDSAVGIFNYAIQSNLKDTTRAAPSFNVKWIPKEEKIMYFTNNTQLVFGFADKILQAFDKVEELVITGHPPNSSISPHVDNQINFRIHFPIIANDKSYFNFENQSFILEPGKAYLVNTSRTHWTDNQGDNDRVHLFFKVPISHIKKIKETEYKL